MLPALLCCVSASLNANPVCLWLTAGPRLFCFSASLQSKQDVCSYIFLILLLPWLLLVCCLAQPLVPNQGNQPIILHSLRDSPCGNHSGPMVRRGNPRSSESLKVSAKQQRNYQINSSLLEEEKYHPSGKCSLLHLRGLHAALQTAGKETSLETAALLGAELRAGQIQVTLFTGQHDTWLESWRDLCCLGFTYHQHFSSH